ncbi:MAG TPA: hypothetical protein VFT00_09265 [Nocardioides sp.]|nr:hypothetical protein [Nocardioides sp.]
MAGARQGVPDLRIGVPTLEPDPVFITQLAAIAAAAGAAGGFAAVRPRPHHLKVALAAASVAAIATGGAWASVALSGNNAPTPPSGPVDHPTAPLMTPTEAPDDDTAVDDQAPEGSAPGADARTARPDDQQGEPTGGSRSAGAPGDGAAPAGAPLPGDTDDEDESGEQQEPGDDDGPDGHDASGSSTDDDEDHHGTGSGDDRDSDHDTAGDDGPEGPDPSDADD